MLFRKGPHKAGLEETSAGKQNDPYVNSHGGYADLTKPLSQESMVDETRAGVLSGNPESSQRQRQKTQNRRASSPDSLSLKPEPCP